VLNPKAWADVPNGQWGLPSENLNLARIWRREAFSAVIRVKF
jgi:hypothetical protein